MKHLVLLLVFLMGCMVGKASAQGITLWQVDNAATPTLVPAYQGQSSPFPAVKVQEAVTADPMLAAAEQARVVALKKAEKLLSSKDAFQPALDQVRVSGRVDGMAGPRVLISNQWVGVGQRLGVRLVRSTKSHSIIDELRGYDAGAATEIEGKLQQKLSKTPYVQMVVKSIGAKEIKLESEYGRQTVPISPGDNPA